MEISLEGQQELPFVSGDAVRIYLEEDEEYRTDGDSGTRIMLKLYSEFQTCRCECTDSPIGQ